MSSPQHALGWFERFLSPSLTGILAEQQGLNRRMDDLREDINRSMDKLDTRMNGLQQSMDTRLAAIEGAILQVQNSLVTALANEGVRTRFAVPETEQPIVQPHRKQPEHDEGYER